MPQLHKFVQGVLEKLKAKYPQYGINGTGNIWIMKPAGKLVALLFRDCSRAFKGKGDKDV